MELNNKIQLFENQHIRTAWDEEKEEWYFSVVDVVGVLTDSVDPTAYWRKLKQRLKAEGNETVTNWGNHLHRRREDAPGENKPDLSRKINHKSCHCTL